MSRARILNVLLLPAIVLSLQAEAQITGSLSGRVADDTGGDLPGAHVEASGPALQGVRTTTSDGSGRYRFSLLPPGHYTISFDLPGFSKETQKGVFIELGQETRLDVKLHVSTEAEVTVTSEATALDSASASLGTSLDAQTLRSLPTGRNYSAVALTMPGISSDANPENTGQSTISVYGSSGAENVFYIDGMNTTGSEYGFQGKELNFEFIEAVDVKTGGYEAEFGRSTGGIINVITKSGGNVLSGDVFGYLDSDGLRRSADPVVSSETVTGFRKTDFGLGIGGFILKDRLWFFGAYDRVANSQDSALPEGPRAGEIATSRSTRDLGSGKLTFRPSGGHSIIASVILDPRDDTGAISDATHSLNGDPLTYEGLRQFGGTDLALRYDGVFDPSWFVSAQVSRHREKNSVGPASGAGDVVQYRDSRANFYQTGGFGLIQDKTFIRDAAGVSVARLWSRHEVKLGLEYERETADVLKRYSGGQQVDAFRNDADPSRPVYSHFYWTTPDATIESAPLSALLASPEHKVTTLYAQDRWTVIPALTVNLGVRWDRQEVIDASGVTQIDLKKDFAPRLGFVWDPKGDKSSRVYGSWGRYYEQLPMDLVIRSFSYERQARIFNYSLTSNARDLSAEAAIGESSTILGGFTEPADPNLRNQYVSEAILGGELEASKGLSVGLKGIYRTYGEVIEDFLCAGDGTYCIGNPGKGIMQRLYTLDYSQTFPSPKAERTYRALQVDLTRAFDGRWQAQASYIYSKLEGNFDGLYSPFTNVGADPNISAAFDYYDFFTDGRDLSKITNSGPLSNDRRHQLKVSGFYQFPFPLSVGLVAYLRSGTPISRYGYSDAYGRYEFFLDPRGSGGRTPSTYEADLHLGYALPVGPAKLNILLDVFNILDAQRPVLVDQRWGFQEADNASPTPVNPGYGKPVLRTPPTSVRLGARVSF